MHRAVCFSLCLVTLGSCSLLRRATGKDGEDGKGWSQSMAEAPSYGLGRSVQVKAPPCSASGYLKIDVEKDKPFHVTTTPSKAGSSCAYVEIVNGAGQTSGASADVCAESGPRTLESKGQEGGTLITVSERYGCAGITVSLAVAEGPAPAAAATEAAPADGPKPEN
ncbi:MAG: hypothetical protein SFX73_32785 [Kofleriaceae bacterium]|nr:hypothetical protein [Kofleriaceae bacterium]